MALLIDSKTGLPDPFTTRYSTSQIRVAGRSVNTIGKALDSIALSLEWAEDRRIDIDQRIDSCDLFTQEETTDLVNWLRQRRKKSIGKAWESPKAAVVHPSTHYDRVHAFKAYVSWRTKCVIHRISLRSGLFEQANAKLASWEEMISGLTRSAPSKKRYGLDPSQRERLLSVIKPDSPKNPFAPHVRQRNYALIMTYYALGVRRAEALVIKGQDLKLNGDSPTLTVHRRADDPEDNRGRQPLVKTAARILPLDQNLRNILETWVIDHRSNRVLYPEAKRHPYIFAGRKGRALSLSSVNDIFERLRSCVPDLPHDFGPHILRHDWNDRFSETCDAMREQERKNDIHPDERLNDALEMSMRNYLMGWKKESTRALTYTNRSIERKSQDMLLLLQRKIFDV
ncbi:tyrosine-type recombinase/integrase [Lacibacterium aquatile]|uniref:Tyrosine-type recombinase/integrase n=1 Tax=Lacibacterium aquatile TaxID=1168082 RepID=A0ABW5DNT9_9PROT